MFPKFAHVRKVQLRVYIQILENMIFTKLSQLNNFNLVPFNLLKFGLNDDIFVPTP